MVPEKMYLYISTLNWCILRNSYLNPYIIWNFYRTSQTEDLLLSKYHLLEYCYIFLKRMSLNSLNNFYQTVFSTCWTPAVQNHISKASYGFFYSCWWPIQSNLAIIQMYVYQTFLHSLLVVLNSYFTSFSFNK